MDHVHVAVLAPRNNLLATLPTASLALLWPWLELVELPTRQILMDPGEPIAALYFPETAYASMLMRFNDGAAAEVGMIGAEGMVGLPLLVGARAGHLEAMVQGPGTALRLPAQALPRALDEVVGLERLLLRYALAFQEQVAQSAACNLRHSLECRMARWLLMAHDRSENDDFPMTQEFLALMLCAARPGITKVAQRMQEAELIRYHRGRITVINRHGLEYAACECYGVMHQRFHELMCRGAN